MTKLPALTVPDGCGTNTFFSYHRGFLSTNSDQHPPVSAPLWRTKAQQSPAPALETSSPVKNSKKVIIT